MKRFRIWWNRNELWLLIGLIVLVILFAVSWLFVSREEVKYWYEMRTFEQRIEGIELALWVLIFIHLIKWK